MAASRTHRFARMAGHGVLLAALFGLSLILNTRHNQFPHVWHPDEVEKPFLVIEGYDTFYHPLLMVNAARLAARVTGVDQPQSVAVTGRWISALFAALAVVAFARAAWLMRGPLAALSVGALIATAQALVVNAHYMKEDTALLLGIGAVFWSMARFEAGRKGVLGIVLMGAATGLAASGKYIGALMLLMTLPLAWRARHGRRSSLPIYFAGFGAIVLLINFHALLAFSHFLRGVSFEVAHVAFTGHNHVRSAWFSPNDLLALSRQIAWPVKLLALLYYIQLPRGGFRRRPMAERLMALFPIAYFFIAAVAMVHQPRYLLPASVALHFLAGIAAHDLATAMPRRWAIPATAGVLALALGVQGMRVAQALDQFEHDARYALPVWMGHLLPDGAVVAQENLVGLNQANMREIEASTGKTIGLVSFYMLARDSGSLEELREQGITHVIVCEPVYGRFFDPASQPARAVRESFEASRAFYETLFQEGQLVWASHSAHPLDAFTNPGLRLYRL